MKILITGANGFLGSWVKEKTSVHYPEAKIFSPSRQEVDLTDKESTVDYFKRVQPDLVIHTAAKVGGINYNRLYPADVFDANSRMALNVLLASHESGVKKLVNISSACAYPGYDDMDLKESNFLNGPMHESVEVYGFSKRALFLGARAYKKQHGLHSVNLVLTNLYGPRDTYDFDRAHVVSALIRRVAEAKKNNAPSITCWGTGKVIREFMYAEDAAEAILRAAKSYEDFNEPLNVGTGIGTSIKELVEAVVSITGYQGEVLWDTTKPEGTLRKVLDTVKMKKELQWEPPTSLEQGLSKTIKWFEENYEEALKRG